MKGRKEKDLEHFKEFYQALGQRLQELRKKAGYDNAEYFAHEAGVSRSQYGKYENAATDIRLLNLLRIAEELEIPIDELLKGLHKIKNF